MSTPPDLRSQASAFADRISDLLNRTITDGIRLTAVIVPRGAIIGYRVTKADPIPLECIPVTLGAAPRCFLNVVHTLTLDREGVWLTAAKSSFGLYLDQIASRVIVHYDFERDPANEYPEAHVQVDGTSEHLRELCERLGIEHQLDRVHFPVGGKRFRPTLEDLIEMMIVEGFADARTGWRDKVEEHRREFYERQLRAAVRRDQEVAAAALQREGWTLRPPEP